MRFNDELTQSEIAERLGVSQMQISRVSRRALWKLLAAVRGEEDDGRPAALGQAGLVEGLIRVGSRAQAAALAESAEIASSRVSNRPTA